MRAGGTRTHAGDIRGGTCVHVCSPSVDAMPNTHEQQKRTNERERARSRALGRQATYEHQVVPFVVPLNGYLPLLQYLLSCVAVARRRGTL